MDQINQILLHQYLIRELYQGKSAFDILLVIVPIAIASLAVIFSWISINQQKKIQEKNQNIALFSARYGLYHYFVNTYHDFNKFMESAIYSYRNEGFKIDYPLMNHNEINIKTREAEMVMNERFVMLIHELYSRIELFEVRYKKYVEQVIMIEEYLLDMLIAYDSQEEVQRKSFQRIIDNNRDREIRIKQELKMIFGEGMFEAFKSLKEFCAIQKEWNLDMKLFNECEEEINLNKIISI